MRTLRGIAKKLPIILGLYRALRYSVSHQDTPQLLESKSTEDTFTEIYKTNAWGGQDSVSGTGSDADQTRIIVKELPVLFKDLNISTLLDIPCGDFHWMKHLELTGIDYIGADIVKELIQKNEVQYLAQGVCFRDLNLLKDSLPKVDLIFCRDCLVHFSFSDIFLALHNICSSQSTYFLTTTFTDRTTNHDIVTGDWRVLNLEHPPFLLPKPLIKVINEGCTEVEGTYGDKSLALWRVTDIQARLLRNLRHSGSSG